MVGNDTRHYLGPHLQCNFGYDHLPSTPTGLAFNLPNFMHRNSRDVAVNLRWWEFWSPNSCIVAYQSSSRENARKLFFQNSQRT
jgi:hypothetical protein